LHNLLRTAVVMVGCEDTIERSHLPDDFLEELAEQPATQPSAQTVAAIGWLEPMATPAPSGPICEAAGHSLQDVALSAVAHMLRQHQGNVSAVAKALGVSRNTIYRKKEQLPQDVWH
jgi:sigma-54 dependent transcriptional regulator, acetoin dehydrogenase operon transcriptional activator AcoR